MSYYTNPVRTMSNKFNRLLSSAGLTMVETLLGMTFTVVIVSIAGFGLINIMRREYNSTTESDIRNDLDRATEFIASEARRSERIAKDQIDIVKVSLPTAAEAILGLTLPNYRDQIIYYTIPATNPWIPPRVLYRWGPPLDVNGNYLLERDTTTGQVINVNWVHSVLVDMLADNTHVTNRDCDNGWKAIPTENNERDGFYVCVKEDNLVRLRLTAIFPTTTSRNKKVSQNIYSTDLKIFARSSN